MLIKTTAANRPGRSTDTAADAPANLYFTTTRYLWLGLGVSSLIVLLVTTVLVVTASLQTTEFALFRIINHVVFPQWVDSQIAKPLSNAVWGMVGLSAAALLVPRYRRQAWRLCAVAGGAYVLVSIIEHIVSRDRPLLLINDATIRAVQDGYGYPSGHVAVITALLLMVWPRVNWPWRAVFMVLIGGEAWSRIYLGMHAPFDTVGGLAIGALAVAIVHLLPDRLLYLLRFKA